MSKQERFFNTVGAINPKDHYFLPHRLNWAHLTDLIKKKYYFILHAPRQSGKTTAIIEFVKHLNLEKNYKALYLSTEPAHGSSNDLKESIRALLEEFRDQIRFFLPEETIALNYLNNVLKKRTLTKTAVLSFLRFWAQESTKPLAIFLDEFDGLVGDTLITLLKQFRTGYTHRPQNFPQTICLIGVRDLRDYKIKTRDQEELGILYSPFNIKAESLLLPDFSLENVKTLYHQHTQETGQSFTDEAIEYAFNQTQGQPWLVNALAYQACFRDIQNRSQQITLDIMQKAKEALIKRCDTHIDALLDKLLEPKVKHIIDAIISGTKEITSFPMNDVQYIRDLGLIAQNSYKIANPIYQEVIPRALIKTMQDRIPQTMPSYLDEKGFLQMDKLLAAFTQFFRENSGIWLKGFEYHESAPHLLLMAFLQRLINGGGIVSREYALDSQKVDLFISWKTQRFVLELKILYNKKTLENGLIQVSDYINKSGAEGHLILFDRDSKKSWDEKIFHKTEIVQGKAIHVWGL